MKKIGGCIYMHKSNLSELTSEQMNLALAAAIKLKEEINIETHILKIDLKNENVSFIECFNWDEKREPVVGNSYLVKKDGTIKVTKGTGKIYHHKWQFVSSDYTGFDVEESKNWSKEWTTKMEILKKDYPKFKSQIGKKEKWDEYLRMCNLPVEK